MSFFLQCLLVEIIFFLLILINHFRGKDWTPLPSLPTGHSGSLCFFAGFSFKHFVVLLGFVCLVVVFFPFFFFAFAWLFVRNSNPLDTLTHAPSPAVKSAAAHL